ncbi:helix-turn-helix domain-containing protein [Wielerella bovis]|uniref:helix-turn-helix domain-containing protein n=1 Tax=Wielerella bovis TaxID=2917790 RepID=UPI0020195491|nr:helix-turn-helix transcriptional regulator [Wielerella bovis]ULJ61027.1 helix-turn-helix transcriptional regulator [Wielerella bovis]
MEAHEIYEKLREKQVSARMIAQVLGVTNQSVSDVIRNGRGSKRIAEAIAKVLDKPLETVFPHYAPKQSHQEKISVLRHQLLGLNG